ncbi:DNA-binding response regulator [Anoxybacillus flavithermus]|uniref:DNA-binding response regulator n=1 Tax=Anoxybacillus flavithermus TaxID=33934 RepID=A0A2G5RQ97_9BACL|nr:MULTISPECIES: response regulator transcription factor [Anoxybacillus]PIC04945.1 DNA-binding response regulator [Anoxybacillus flavithermus]
MKIKVLLVDDHVLMIEGLKELLEREEDMYVVGTVLHLSQLQESIETLNPHVIVMDIRLKDGNGLEWTKKMKMLYPNCKVVILSGYNYSEYIRAAKHAGASAFVVKEESILQLANAIRRAYEGFAFFPNDVDEEENISLTKMELVILKLIAQDKTNENISHSLNLSRRTVEHHVSTIIKKLRVDSRVGAVVKAIKEGIIEP